MHTNRLSIWAVMIEVYDAYGKPWRWEIFSDFDTRKDAEKSIRDARKAGRAKGVRLIVVRMIPSAPLPPITEKA